MGLLPKSVALDFPSGLLPKLDLGLLPNFEGLTKFDDAYLFKLIIVIRHAQCTGNTMSRLYLINT